MALVSKTEAAKLAGVTRPTFYRHISKGKVSVVDNKDGTQSIDTAELLRVYGELQPTLDVMDATKPDATLQADTPLGVNVELLEYKIEQLEKQLKESEARNSNTQEQNNKLIDTIQTQSLALEHVKSPGILDRLFGKK